MKIVAVTEKKNNVIKKYFILKKIFCICYIFIFFTIYNLNIFNYFLYISFFENSYWK